jgi:uncharacterized protein YecE (DUF72 family)
VALIGTAGWNIPAQYGSEFPASGTHLERYAGILKAVEINSSFYRPHQRKTYERWAASVPADFRFSVKLPRGITHDNRLKDHGDLLDRFLDETSGLGGKLGILLVQLPPSLAYEAATAAAFFRDLARARARIACEPRHASWFTPQAEALLHQWHVARVAADPPRAPGDGVPGGDTGFAYWRLHGSPKLYYSDYSDAALAALAPRLRPQDWCIFDNTAAFHALGNALSVASLAEPFEVPPVVENDDANPGGTQMARKYPKKAAKKVKKVMEERKKGTLRSGPGGKGGKVTSRKQAIAIGLSEARKEGAKVPGKTKKKAKKKS